MRIITSSSEDNNYIKIGKILKTKGVDGKVIIEIYTDDISKYDNIYIKEDGLYQKLSLINVNETSDNIIEAYMKRKENIITDIEYLKSLIKNNENNIYILKEDMKDLKKNEVYVHDIIGLSVYDENEKLLGKVIDVLEILNNININVVLENGKEISIPYNDKYILGHDKNSIHVDISELRKVYGI